MENVNEKAIEDYLDACVQARDGVTRAIEYRGRRGCPDRLIVLPFFVGCAELKRPVGGVHSGLQKIEREILQRIHEDAYIDFSTKEKIAEWMRAYDREWDL